MTHNYANQFFANVAALQFQNDYRGRYQVLRKVYSAFEDAHIKWELSCSSALFFNGIVDNFHDLDLLIAPNDFDHAVEILKTLGHQTDIENTFAHNGYFYDLHYAQFYIDGIHIDAISEFGFVVFDTFYQHHFNAQETEHIAACGLNVPVVSMETQFILYGMMACFQPHRIFKQNLIKEYLMSHNMRQPSILRSALSAQLPPALKKHIFDILHHEE